MARFLNTQQIGIADFHDGHSIALQFYQLATVKPDGKPANRTVVHRGFEGDSERLLFVTDTRCDQYYCESKQQIFTLKSRFLAV